ncbi:MAG: hypothetical protein ACHQUB_03525 [Candidatus Saccharimonadia bacterium]
MTGLETTLVIILAVGFGLLLLLSIIVVFIIISILQNIRHITQKAENATDNLAEIAKAVAQKAGPGLASALIGLAMKKFKKSHKSEKEEE